MDFDNDLFTFPDVAKLKQLLLLYSFEDDYDGGKDRATMSY